MAWKYVISDLNGRSLGEPRAFEREAHFGVNQVATAGFRIRANDALWDTIAGGTSNLKIYNSAGALVFYGPVITDEESGSSGQGAEGTTVKCSAADASWIFQKRFIGRDNAAVGQVFAATDAIQIVAQCLALINADEATGITLGNVNTAVPQSVTYLWKRMADIVAELSQLDSSYEYSLRYVDAAAGSATAPTVYLDLLSQIGSDRTATVSLDYGTGRRNCQAYSRVRTKDTLATDVWAIGGSSTLVSNASDAGARASYKRHEDVLTVSDITNATLLTALAAANVAVRKQPRTVVSLTPFTKTGPKYGVDYSHGDTVMANVVAFNRSRFSGRVRIWTVDISIDELGNERATTNLTAAS